VIFALYFLLSGLERFLVEFIRRNSEVLAGLTAPQLESLGLMVIGATWLAVLLRGGGVQALRPSPA
jgi:phosphatidylglycerol:prolipoprotein diacylglycerol transferase